MYICHGKHGQAFPNLCRSTKSPPSTVSTNKKADKIKQSMQHAMTAWHKWVTAEVNFYKKWRNDCHMDGWHILKKLPVDSNCYYTTGKKDQCIALTVALTKRLVGALNISK